MANDGTKFLKGAYRVCLFLLETSFVVGTTALCYNYAQISFDQTRKLQDDTVAFTFKRVDGFDIDSDVSISKFHFLRFISCLQLERNTLGRVRPCLMLVAFSKESNGVYHYTVTIPLTSRSDNMSSQRRRNYECTLPDSFLSTSQVECTEQFNLQECFNSSHVCSSIIPQYNNTTETIYNVIWKSRGSITFSYNKNVVVVEPCFKQSSDETNSTGVIVGVVCALLVCGILIVIVVIYWQCKKPSTAKGLQPSEGASSSVAPAVLHQTDPSPENAEPLSSVDQDCISPYEQVDLDTNGAGYAAVHTDMIENRDENQKLRQHRHISNADAGPSITDSQHLREEAASPEDGTFHSNQAGHTSTYYNTQETGEKLVQQSKVKESPESAFASVAKDRDKTYYNELDKEDGETETDGAGSKGHGHNYYNFILEDGDDHTVDT